MATILARRSALAASTLRSRAPLSCPVARLSTSSLFSTQRIQPPAVQSHAFKQHREDAAMSAVRSLCVPDRGVLAFEGRSAFCLLQRLTTKNVAKLIPSTLEYTMFLTEEGIVLGDAFLYYIDDNDILVDCDIRVLPRIQEHVKAQRRDEEEVEMFNASSKYKVFSVVNGSGGLDGGVGGEDPRLCVPCGLAADDEAWVLSRLGEELHTFERYIIPDDMTPELNSGARIIDEHVYLGLRIRLGVSEGAVDHPPMAAHPVECNLDHLNGLDMSKDFLGRAALKRTGNFEDVARRIMPISLESKLAQGSMEGGWLKDLKTGKRCGTLLSYDTEAAYALGLVELESVHHDLELHGSEHSDTGTQVARVTRPVWMSEEVFKSLGKNK